jgi:hypothetical protein
MAFYMRGGIQRALVFHFYGACNIPKQEPVRFALPAWSQESRYYDVLRLDIAHLQFLTVNLPGAKGDPISTFEDLVSYRDQEDGNTSIFCFIVK